MDASYQLPASEPVMRCLCAGHGVTLGSRMGVSHRISRTVPPAPLLASVPATVRHIKHSVMGAFLVKSLDKSINNVYTIYGERKRETESD